MSKFETSLNDQQVKEVKKLYTQLLKSYLKVQEDRFILNALIPSLDNAYSEGGYSEKLSGMRRFYDLMQNDMGAHDGDVEKSLKFMESILQYNDVDANLEKDRVKWAHKLRETKYI